MPLQRLALNVGDELDDHRPDASDVIVSYAAQWDAANPLHKGRTGGFDYWLALFGGFLNPPPA